MKMSYNVLLFDNNPEQFQEIKSAIIKSVEIEGNYELRIFQTAETNTLKPTRSYRPEKDNVQCCLREGCFGNQLIKI